MFLKYPMYWICISLFLAHCSPSSENEGLFEEGRALGTNKNRNLEEASGLEASESNPSYFWTHNDSGNPAELFLLDKNAQTKKVFTLARIRNRDWEDITLGRGPEEDVTYLYIGDIGDNMALYPVKFIYRIKEPTFDQPDTIHSFDTLMVKLQEGNDDMETLMSDPVTKNLYLVSKARHSAWLYEISQPFTEDTLIARKMAVIPLKHVVSGDVSPDGKEVLLKSYEHIYYWKKTADESLVELLKTPGTELPYDRDREPQGEAIAWARDGTGFFTLGENARGERAKLLFYKRK